MPIQRILRPVVTIEETRVSATCNVCGKTKKTGSFGGIPEDFHLIELQGGYGSEFPGDMEKFEIVVCEDCLRAWVKTFKHPDVSQGSGMFPLATKALHTETEKVMTVERYIAVEGDEVPKEAWKWQGLPEPENEPGENTIWQHFKGGIYKVLGTVWEWPSKTPLVHYQALYGDNECFLRPLDMFMGHTEPHVPRFTHMTLE